MKETESEAERTRGFKELFCLLDFIGLVELRFVGLLLFAVGAGGALFSALALLDESLAKRAGRLKGRLEGRSEKRRVSPILFFIGVAFVGAFLFSYSELTATTTSVSAASPVPSSGQDYRVLESKTEAFLKPVSAAECEGVRDFVYWRELRVYAATRVYGNGVNKTVFLSTFTLTLQNKGGAVSNVLVTERIPDVVAAEPGQVFNFSVAPASVRKGSVVVDWLFEGVDSGEKKSVSYTVEKKVGAEALKDFDAPNVVARAVAQGAAAPNAVARAANEGAAEGAAAPNALEAQIATVPEQKAGVDWTIPGIILAVAIVGSVVLFFSRKLRQAD